MNNCPWCGADGSRAVFTPPDGIAWYCTGQVQCQDCGKGVIAQDAVAVWNAMPNIGANDHLLEVLLWEAEKRQVSQYLVKLRGDLKREIEVSDPRDVTPLWKAYFNAELALIELAVLCPLLSLEEILSFAWEASCRHADKTS